MNATDKIVYLAVFAACYILFHGVMALLAIPGSHWANIAAALASAFTAYGVRKWRRGEV